MCCYLTLLQIWSWSRLILGRPTLRHFVPLDGEQSLGCRFNVQLTWDLGPDRSILFYQNELDLPDDSSVVWRLYTNDIFDSYHYCAVMEPTYSLHRLQSYASTLLRCICQTIYYDNLGVISTYRLMWSVLIRPKG